MSKWIAVLHTGDYRGSHTETVERHYEVREGETVDALMARIMVPNSYVRDQYVSLYECKP